MGSKHLKTSLTKRGTATFYYDSSYLEQISSRHYSGQFSYIPLPTYFEVCGCTFEPSFVKKRNERERQRVRYVNEGYARLREHLPSEFADKRLSKVETLRAAINYIKHLQSLLKYKPSIPSRKEEDVSMLISEPSTAILENNCFRDAESKISTDSSPHS
ncbi:achaete-scute homolog 4-like [Protopterus annectens]|uniref:achaete-scute homolog 4-like n=1 Tax=Protopterus annectens TaxID=7888 RepID=UPI001CFA8171|nr:achaete-scute homolog 4-like [Protopterus annectens]